MSKPEFTVIAYDAAQHYDVAAAFWQGHDVEPWPRQVMAHRGCVLLLGDDVAAIGHFYLTDSNVAILAPMVTNPAMSDRQQAAAIGRLVEALSQAARIAVPSGFLLALAHDPAVKNLFVKRAGFRDTGSIGTACLVTAEPAFSLAIIEED